MVKVSTHTGRKPLSAFPQIRTTDVAALEASVDQFYPGAKFEVTGAAPDFAVDANRCGLTEIALTYSSFDAPIRITIPQLENYSLLFAHGGRARGAAGRADIPIANDQAFVGSIGGSVRLDYAAGFEQLVLGINPNALNRKLASLIGEAPPRQLALEPSWDFRQPHAGNVRQMYMFLVEQLASNSSGIHPLILAEFEQAILVSVLIASRHNCSHLLHRQPLATDPRQVRKAEAYIEANWDQPLSIEALALVTGVSTRSIFHSFRKARGYSPMEFVKRVRLTHAWNMLSKPDSSTSVTDVAFACGFGNLGHFANYYRRRFDELPSETLQRSRRPSK